LKFIGKFIVKEWKRKLKFIEAFILDFIKAGLLNMIENSCGIQYR